METFCRLVGRDVEDILHTKNNYQTFNNLSRAERHALSDLQSDASIIKADKGGALVILSAPDNCKILIFIFICQVTLTPRFKVI